MKRELSCGAVIYREEQNKKLYLLLHYPAGHWDFPKGHITAKESIQECAKREIEEETGITTLEFISGFKEKLHYFFKQKKTLISKDVIYLLAKTTTKKVQISFEHTGYTWKPYKDALRLLTYKTSKEVLTKADYNRRPK